MNPGRRNIVTLHDIPMDCTKNENCKRNVGQYNRLEMSSHEQFKIKIYEKHFVYKNFLKLKF